MATRIRVLCAIALAACGHAAAPAPSFRPPPRLSPPPTADPQAFGRAYLDKVAVRLQGDWGAFLEDLRLRLPPTDPLNDPRLAVTLDWAVARDGSIGDLHVTTSGNGAFDRAAVEIVRDAAPLAAAPDELVSDDDRVHLRWTFARDRRQAGASGAKVDRIEWPIDRAVPKLLGQGDLAEAARRIEAAAADAPPPASIDSLAEDVFVAAITEALASSDVSVRREAAAAIEVVRGRTLIAQAIELARGSAFDLEVRAHAIRAIGASIADGDDRGAPILRELLAAPDLPAPLLAVTARALAEHGGGDDVARAAQGWLGPAPAAALAALATVPAPQAVVAIAKLAKSADPITRAAACAALAPSAAAPAAWAGIRRGLDDADATVRAACADAAGKAAAVARVPAPGAARIVALLRDRDERVRAAAALAIPSIDPARAAAELRALPTDKSAAVRAALATAWGRVPGATPAALIALAGDSEPTVRAAAVAALAARPGDPDARALAAKLAPDPDPAVRAAAVAAIAGADDLAGLIADDDPLVRTAALDRDAMLRGRAAALAARAAALAAAPPASADRVRIARSWLLAR